MYVYRVYNKKEKVFRRNFSSSRTVWLRLSDANRMIPERFKHDYEIKKYELVEVPCE